jgi:hypothetical protein
MNRKRYLALYIVQLVVLLVVASFQHDPGYMDASYYFGGALRLAQGEGFTEMIVWNFLDDPAGLPHPSHGYWMPLTSIVAALGIKLFFFLPAFEAAQIFLIALAANIAPLTAMIAFQITEQQDQAWVAGAFAILSGYFLPFLTTTDVFAVNMLLGAAFFLLLLKTPRWWPAGLGIVSSLLYLARADGLLWFGIGGLAILLDGLKSREGKMLATRLVQFGAGFALLAAPWMTRNQLVFGTPLAPGGSRALWIVVYDELFFFPARLLTMERWLAAGPAAWWAGWGFALQQNTLSLIAVQGSILLFPLLLIGIWKRRGERFVRLGVLAWFVIFVEMTLVFPYIGARGGFFHSISTLMPFVWALSVIGLAQAGTWAARIPRWTDEGAWRLMRIVSLAGIAVISGLIVARQVVQSPWDEYAVMYRALDQQLVQLGIPDREVVMVNNAPSFYTTTGRPAMNYPGGDVEMLINAAWHYSVRYVVIDENSAESLRPLFAHPLEVEGVELLWEDGQQRLLFLEDVGGND